MDDPRLVFFISERLFTSLWYWEAEENVKVVHTASGLNSCTLGLRVSESRLIEICTDT